MEDSTKKRFLSMLSHQVQYLTEAVLARHRPRSWLSLRRGGGGGDTDSQAAAAAAAVRELGTSELPRSLSGLN